MVNEANMDFGVGGRGRWMRKRWGFYEGTEYLDDI